MFVLCIKYSKDKKAKCRTIKTKKQELMTYEQDIVTSELHRRWNDAVAVFVGVHEIIIYIDM